MKVITFSTAVFMLLDKDNLLVTIHFAEAFIQCANYTMTMGGGGGANFFSRGKGEPGKARRVV